MGFDVRSYMEKVDKLMLESGAVSEVYGEIDGYELVGYDLMRGDYPVVYISTGIHGDELAGPESLLSLLEGGLLDRPLSFHVCPMLNPIGCVAGTRENGRGLDMNRDYFHQCSSEVRGHVGWLEKRDPELFISLHEDWESEGFYYYEINLGLDSVARYEYLAGEIMGCMPLEEGLEIDGHEVRRRGWIYHDAESDEMECWPEAIYMAKKGCALSFTLESPSALEMSKRVDVQLAAVGGILDYIYGE